jgi:hypothetical protein
MKLKKQTLYVTPPHFISNSVRSVSSVVKPSSNPSSSGSALILTLLITALLATITVSFLSTSRVEQIAARNFSRQNAASGLAELATGQAMASIQTAFNGNGTGTGIVVTQPGAISKYFFSNGNCTNTSNATTNLFFTSNSANANGTVNINNLFANSTVSGLITGNASEAITVASVNVLSGNQVIGKVAYYVDDELTKLNINGATDNRTTLNVSLPRSLSLSAVNSGNLTAFRSSIDGTMSETSSMLNNWGHHFRVDQTIRHTSGSGGNISLSLGNKGLLNNATTGLSVSNQRNFVAWLKGNISTAPLSDFHLKYTPWGARRLHINDEPLNSTGVDNVYNALNSQFLSNIYGQTFNDKYGQQWSWTGNMSQTSNTTVNGLKQIAANMLQMRTPGSHDISLVRSPYTGPVISENGTATFPPSGYYADIPSGCINEFGFKINYQDYDEGPGGRRGILLYPMPIIEFLLASYWPYGDIGNVFLEATIQSLTFTLSDSLGNTTNRTIGPLRLSGTFDLNNFAKIVTNGSDGTRLLPYHQLTSQQNIFNNGATPAFNGNNNLPWSIVGNPTLVMGDVKLYAGSSNASDALRDWLSGNFIMSKLGSNGTIVLNTPFALSQYAVKNQTPSNPPNFLGGNITSAGAPRVTTPYNASQNQTYETRVTSGTSLQSWPSAGNATTSGVIFKTLSDHLTSEARANFRGNSTLQRIDSRVKGETAWAVAPFTYPTDETAIFTERSTNTSSNRLNGGHNTYYGGYGLRPSETATRDIPGDSSPMGDNEPDYFITTEHSWIYLPRKLYTLDSIGNATFNSPNDLGKVSTNVNWRRLRFMPRHRLEAAKNLIPDWAMLDVISFSSNNSSSSNLKIAPINPNGAFAVDTSINNSTITPRNNIPALIKALESTSDTDFQLGSALARTVSGSNMTFDKVDMRFEGTDFITFRGNTPFATSISGNITSNSTTKWSTTNSTWSAWRTANKWPATSLILPGEVTEIRGVADYGRRSQYQYDNSGTSGFKSIKENEGRLSAFFPGLTTCSNFFTIYAYAQALDKLGNIDSEALTKTLVEVEITAPATATTAAQYKVKKLYTQPIPLGQ